MNFISIDDSEVVLMRHVVYLKKASHTLQKAATGEICGQDFAIEIGTTQGRHFISFESEVQRDQKFEIILQNTINTRGY